MSWYLSPPKGTVAFHKLEEYATKRLQFLLRLVASFGNDKEVDEVLQDADVVDQSDCLITNTAKDEISHHILRLTLGGDPESTQFFCDSELVLFKLRIERMVVDEWVVFLKSADRFLCKLRGNVTAVCCSAVLDLMLIFDILKGKFESWHYLSDEICSDENNSGSANIPFHLVLSLVCGRKVDIFKGVAAVPVAFLKDVFIEQFEKLLATATLQACHWREQALKDVRVKLLTANLKRLLRSETRSSRTYHPDQFPPLRLSDLWLQASIFPPCMANVVNRLQKLHRLKHQDRIQLTLFLKELGLPLNDALLLWKREYSIPSCTINTKGCQQGWQGNERRYIYNIRHLYGLEGSRIDYRAHSCTSIQGRSLSCGDAGGCPFVSADSSTLKSLFSDQRMDLCDIDYLMELCTQRQVATACQRFMVHKLTQARTKQNNSRMQEESLKTEVVNSHRESFSCDNYIEIKTQYCALSETKQSTVARSHLGIFEENLSYRLANSSILKSEQKLDLLSMKDPSGSGGNMQREVTNLGQTFPPLADFKQLLPPWTEFNKLHVYPGVQRSMVDICDNFNLRTEKHGSGSLSSASGGMVNCGSGLLSHTSDCTLNQGSCSLNHTSDGNMNHGSCSLNHTSSDGTMNQGSCSLNHTSSDGTMNHGSCSLNHTSSDGTMNHGSCSLNHTSGSTMNHGSCSLNHTSGSTMNHGSSSLNHTSGSTMNHGSCSLNHTSSDGTMNHGSCSLNHTSGSTMNHGSCSLNHTSSDGTMNHGSCSLNHTSGSTMNHGSCSSRGRNGTSGNSNLCGSGCGWQSMCSSMVKHEQSLGSRTKYQRLTLGIARMCPAEPRATVSEFRSVICNKQLIMYKQKRLLFKRKNTTRAGPSWTKMYLKPGGIEKCTSLAGFTGNRRKEICPNRQPKESDIGPGVSPERVCFNPGNLDTCTSLPESLSTCNGRKDICPNRQPKEFRSGLSPERICLKPTDNLDVSMSLTASQSVSRGHKEFCHNTKPKVLELSPQLSSKRVCLKPGYLDTSKTLSGSQSATNEHKTVCSQRQLKESEYMPGLSQQRGCLKLLGDLHGDTYFPDSQSAANGHKAICPNRQQKQFELVPGSPQKICFKLRGDLDTYLLGSPSATNGHKAICPNRQLEESELVPMLSQKKICLKYDNLNTCTFLPGYQSASNEHKEISPNWQSTDNDNKLEKIQSRYQIGSAAEKTFVVKKPRDFYWFCRMHVGQ